MRTRTHKHSLRARRSYSWDGPNERLDHARDVAVGKHAGSGADVEGGSGAERKPRKSHSDLFRPPDASVSGTCSNVYARLDAFCAQSSTRSPVPSGTKLQNSHLPSCCIVVVGQCRILRNDTTIASICVQLDIPFLSVLSLDG